MVFERRDTDKPPPDPHLANHETDRVSAEPDWPNGEQRGQADRGVTSDGAPSSAPVTLMG
jgi:hypothetical protein